MAELSFHLTVMVYFRMETHQRDVPFVVLNMKENGIWVMLTMKVFIKIYHHGNQLVDGVQVIDLIGLPVQHS